MINDTYYHAYNRGAHKAQIFYEAEDYERMLKLLYIANNDVPFAIRDAPQNIFTVDRKKILVDIIAYCLMPNHVHIAVKPRRGLGDLSRFMHKLMTGYSGYFNKKYDHSGTIWQGPYKEKAVHDELYLNTLIRYIHLNPYGIEEPEMTKEARSEYTEKAVLYSREYEYSSYKDHLGIIRPQNAILNLTEARPK